jgi:peroxiredoxin
MRILNLRSLLVAGMAATLFACTGGGAQTPTNHPLIGNPAPDFSVDAVPDSKGSVALASEKGKVVVLDFWGTFCGPCQESFPKLHDLNTKYHAQGLDIIGVSVDEEEKKEDIQPFLTKTGADFIIGWDPGGEKVAPKYSLGTMPFSFVIDKKGLVRYVHSGWHEGEADELDKQIKELLAE